jgi:methyl-accepting chemotaxis protein
MDLTKKVKEIAHGDLTVKIDAKGGDEIGTLSRSLAAMVSSLWDILDRISASSEAVASSVNELRTISRNTSDGAKSQ